MHCFKLATLHCEHERGATREREERKVRDAFIVERPQLFRLAFPATHSTIWTQAVLTPCVQHCSAITMLAFTRSREKHLTTLQVPEEGGSVDRCQAAWFHS